MQLSDWRNGHYIIDLGKMLDISEALEIPQYTESVVQHLPNVSSIQDSRPQGSPPSSSFASQQDDTSPTSVISSVFTDTSHTMGASSQNTSPTTTTSQDSSISPTSSTNSSGNSKPSPVICRACSKEFKGNYQDAMSNLRRHRRESPRHNENHGVKCPRPECQDKRRMRSDNLKKHLLDFHKMSDLPPDELQGIIDRCKAEAKVRGHGDGTHRCRSRAG